MKRLEGKVAVVTGAGSGIGEATARLFAEEGAKVMVADIDDKNGETVADRIKGKGNVASFVHCDVSRAVEVQALINTTVEVYGKLDIMVNNAGIFGEGKCHSTPLDEWERGLAIDLSGVFYGCKYALQAMLKNNGGTIVNVASISGLYGDYDTFWYNAAKGGVCNLTRSIAVDYARSGIRCNAVNPGDTLTPIVKRYFDRDQLAKDGMGRNYPMGRPGTPKEVAYCILFLASDESSIVTGVNLPCDGGLTAHSGQPAYAAMEEYLSRKYVDPPLDRF